MVCERALGEPDGGLGGGEGAREVLDGEGVVGGFEGGFAVGGFGRHDELCLFVGVWVFYYDCAMLGCWGDKWFVRTWIDLSGKKRTLCWLLGESGGE